MSATTSAELIDAVDTGREADVKESDIEAGASPAEAEKSIESAISVIDSLAKPLGDAYIGKSVSELEEAIEADAPVKISEKNAHAWTSRVLASLLQGAVFLSMFAFLYSGALWTPRTQNIVLGVAVAPQLDYSVFPAAAVAKLPSPQELVNTTFVQAFKAFTKDRFAFQFMEDVTDRETILATVDDGARVWGAIFVPSDYSRNLVAGILGVNGTPPSTVEYIHDSGRGYNIDTSFVNALLQFQTSFRSGLAQNLVKIVGAANVTTFWIDGPVQMKLTNIHPVTKPAQDTMTLITMVLILVASILSANFIAKIKVPSDRIRQGILRLYFAIPFMLVLSFVITGAPFALGSTQGNFARVWFWWFYVGLTSLSFVSMLFTLLGNKIGQGIVMLFLYVFITSSGGLTEILLTHDFYRIGYALFPFFAVHGCRAIVFESQQHLLYRDALVILAWFVFCIVVQSIAYIRGVNERVGQKMNTRAARKIVVPEKLGKQPLKFLKRVVSTDLDVPDLLAKS